MTLLTNIQDFTTQVTQLTNVRHPYIEIDLTFEEVYFFEGGNLIAIASYHDEPLTDNNVINYELNTYDFRKLNFLDGDLNNYTLIINSKKHYGKQVTQWT